MRVSVIGPGSFGTAIAQVISRNVDEVSLLGRNVEVIDSINQNHVNYNYFPLIKLNKNIKAYDIEKDRDVLNDSDLVFIATPSGVLREVVNPLKHELEDKLIISTMKGVEYPSLKFMTEIIKEETGNDNVFSISGPTFADEVINNHLSGLTLGIDKLEYKKEIINLFDSSNLLIDYSFDVIGVDTCGVLKNIYAVAMGIFDSFYSGFNEHYIFLNLCFKEMRAILSELGHDSELLFHFCGFGDLNLTACVDKSRNRTLGLMIGKNISLNLDKSTITIEGVKSARAIRNMVEKSEIHTPILDMVNQSFDNPENIRDYVNTVLKEIKNDY